MLECMEWFDTLKWFTLKHTVVVTKVKIVPFTMYAHMHSSCHGECERDSCGDSDKDGDGHKHTSTGCSCSTWFK